MKRARFKANEEDWRPVKWPPPGPCWCTGYGDGYATVVAYVNAESEIAEYWPEARDVDIGDDEAIRFSDRFPKPDWWEEKP